MSLSCAIPLPHSAGSAASASTLSSKKSLDMTPARQFQAWDRVLRSGFIDPSFPILVILEKSVNGPIEDRISLCDRTIDWLHTASQYFCYLNYASQSLETIPFAEAEIPPHFSKEERGKLLRMAAYENKENLLFRILNSVRDFRLDDLRGARLYAHITGSKAVEMIDSKIEEMRKKRPQPVGELLNNLEEAPVFADPFLSNPTYLLSKLDIDSHLALPHLPQPFRNQLRLLVANNVKFFKDYTNESIFSIFKSALKDGDAKTIRCLNVTGNISILLKTWYITDRLHISVIEELQKFIRGTHEFKTSVEATEDFFRSLIEADLIPDEQVKKMYLNSLMWYCPFSLGFVLCKMGKIPGQWEALRRDTEEALMQRNFSRFALNLREAEARKFPTEFSQSFLFRAYDSCIEDRPLILQLMKTFRYIHPENVTSGYEELAKAFPKNVCVIQ